MVSRRQRDSFIRDEWHFTDEATGLLNRSQGWENDGPTTNQFAGLDPRIT